MENKNAAVYSLSREALLTLTFASIGICALLYLGAILLHNPLSYLLILLSIFFWVNLYITLYVPPITLFDTHMIIRTRNKYGLGWYSHRSIPYESIKSMNFTSSMVSKVLNVWTSPQISTSDHIPINVKGVENYTSLIKILEEKTHLPCFVK